MTVDGALGLKPNSERFACLICADDYYQPASVGLVKTCRRTRMKRMFFEVPRKPQLRPS